MSLSSVAPGSFPEQNPNPVLELGVQGELLYVNPAAKRVFPHLQDDASHPVRTGLQEVVERLHRAELDQEKRRIRVNGRVYEQYLSLVEGSESLRSYLFDVTERFDVETTQHEMEAFYQRILRELPTELAVLDPEGRYLYVNPAAVGDPEVRRWLIGRTTLDYAEYTDMDPEPFRRRHEWIRKVAERKEPGRIEETLELPNGDVRHFLRIMHPILDENGNVRRLVGYGLDLTERKRFENELRKAKEEAEQASELKSAMIANVSHEIRTPLTSILGFAEVIRDGTADDEQEFAELILKSGRRLLQTLDSILELSSLQAGSTEQDGERIDLVDTVADAVDMLEPQAAQADIQLLYEPTTQSVWIPVSEDACRRIATNLIRNAIKFSHPGDVVRVRVFKQDQMGRLQVEDEGVGIREEKLEQIFEPFQQESSGSTREYDGVGLGLTIVRRLTDQFGGSIDVKSHKGEGSCFTISFPLTDY